MASSRNNHSTEAVTATEARIRDSLHKLIPPGGKATLALSGGLDSRVLLALAAEHAASGACSLSAIHVHHGLSPNADQWSAFCADICAQADVPLEIVKLTVPRDTGEGIEAAARRMRYQAFDNIDSGHVLLAHHCNDQAETVLLNLMRGAGVRGAAAMQAVSGAAGRYLRPLLAVSRTELEAIAKARNLSWIEDESNADTAFSRNHVRLNVMPALLEKFPAAAENLARAAEHFAEAQQMLDEMAVHDLGGHRGFPVPLSVLQPLSPARARNVLRYLLAAADLQAPSASKLQEALRQFLEAAPDRHPSLDLPQYRLFRQKGQIHLGRT